MWVVPGARSALLELHAEARLRLALELELEHNSWCPQIEVTNSSTTPGAHKSR